MSARLSRWLSEQSRKSLKMLAETADASILRTFQALSEVNDIRPGCLGALRTFGGY
jgi:hypothetical protein